MIRATKIFFNNNRDLKRKLFIGMPAKVLTKESIIIHALSIVVRRFYNANLAKKIIQPRTQERFDSQIATTRNRFLELNCRCRNQRKFAATSANISSRLLRRTLILGAPSFWFSKVSRTAWIFSGHLTVLRRPDLPLFRLQLVLFAVYFATFL